jgi:hypothetical protein
MSQFSGINFKKYEGVALDTQFEDDIQVASKEDLGRGSI